MGAELYICLMALLFRVHELCLAQVSEGRGQVSNQKLSESRGLRGPGPGPIDGAGRAKRRHRGLSPPCVN